MPVDRQAGLNDQIGVAKLVGEQFRFIQQWLVQHRQVVLLNVIWVVVAQHFIEERTDALADEFVADGFD